MSTSIHLKMVSLATCRQHRDSIVLIARAMPL